MTAAVTAQDKADDRTVERIAALLKTAPQIAHNYTACKDAAAWIVREAERLGWTITIEEAK